MKRAFLFFSIVAALTLGSARGESTLPFTPSLSARLAKSLEFVTMVQITGCSASFQRTTASLGDPTNAPTGCVYTITAGLLTPTAPASAWPGMTFSTMPAGKYFFVYIGTVGHAGATFDQTNQLSDGSNTSPEVQDVSTSASGYVPIIAGTLTYGTTQTNVTIRFQTKGNGTQFGEIYGMSSLPGVIWVFKL